MKRATVLAMLRIQYVFGFIFAAIGTCFGWLVFTQFRVTGVPMVGSDQTLDAFACAASITALAMIFGISASLVAKHQLRKISIGPVRLKGTK